ncbi:MAG: hypothetical protein GWO24_16950, partial [Akkermansiaceae bacterium]|nr:hypothetical protein [Akkermansiaceae bacterium]
GLPTEDLGFLWQKVSGPGPLSFTAPEDPTTGVIVAVPGEYVIRLTADDGELFGSDELLLTATCPLGRPPLDLYLQIDHTGSMFGPSEGVIDELNPDAAIHQARLFALALID